MDQKEGPAYFKNIAWGCLEMVAFLPRSLLRFDNTRQGAELSFLALLPVILLGGLWQSFDPMYAGVNLSTIILIACLRIFIALAGFLGLVWLLCWGLTRKGVFLRFVTMMNWASGTISLALIPLLLVLALNPAAWEPSFDYFFIVMLFGYGVTAFIARHVLKISWVGGVFFGFASLFIDITVSQMFSP